MGVGNSASTSPTVIRHYPPVPEVSYLPEVNGSSPQCSSCGGKTKSTLVDVTMWTGRGLVVIENVPVQVCENCQEQFYEKDAAMKIQELVSQGFPSSRLVREIKVPIYSLREGAAPSLPEDHEN